jgi:DNA polymerase III delta' subunit
MALNLTQIVCQDKAIAGLQQAFAAGRMPHAYLFSGEDGVGKYTTARAWAKMLLCQNPAHRHGTTPFADSCGQCPSCQLFESGGHPDFQPVYKELIVFTKDGKNRTTPVDMPINVIREFLIDKVAARPQMSQHVVYVIQEAEKVNPSSQNAMLKVLEEPPAFCTIILICSRIEKMLPTILSRCHVVRFGPVEPSVIVKKLSENGVSDPESGYWAGFSQGRLGQALTWASLKTKDDSPYLIKRQMLERLAVARLPDVLEQAEWISKAAKQIAAAWTAVSENVSTTDINRRAQKGLIQMAALAFSDALKLKTAAAKDIVNADQKAVIRQLADKYDPEFLSLMVTRMYELTRWVDDSVNEKLIFEQLLLNLTHSDILFLSIG